MRDPLQPVGTQRKITRESQSVFPGRDSAHQHPATANDTAFTAAAQRCAESKADERPPWE